jgi:hypothetical protein
MMRVLEILVAVLRKIVPENLRVLKKIWGLKRFFKGESKNNKLKFSWFLDFPTFDISSLGLQVKFLENLSQPMDNLIFHKLKKRTCMCKALRGM